MKPAAPLMHKFAANREAKPAEVIEIFRTLRHGVTHRIGGGCGNSYEDKSFPAARASFVRFAPTTAKLQQICVQQTLVRPSPIG
jgi:hypothetical protein